MRGTVRDERSDTARSPIREDETRGNSRVEKDPVVTGGVMADRCCGPRGSKTFEYAVTKVDDVNGASQVVRRVLPRKEEDEQ